MAHTTVSQGVAEAGNPWPRRVGLLLGAAVLVAAIVYFRKDVASLPATISGWIASLGIWGPIAYAGLYAIGAVLMAPGSLLTMLGGALFGLGLGTVVVFVGATLGASLAFLISRYLARDWIAARIARSESLAKIDRAVGVEGLKIVFLLRLSPLVPFNVLNFMLGLTRVGFRDYVLACTGMLPGTLLYVYYGKVIGDVAQLATGPKPEGWSSFLLKVVGLLATLAVSVYVARIAKRALDQELPREEGA